MTPTYSSSKVAFEMSVYIYMQLLLYNNLPSFNFLYTIMLFKVMSQCHSKDDINDKWFLCKILVNFQTITWQDNRYFWKEVLSNLIFKEEAAISYRMILETIIQQ